MPEMPVDGREPVGVRRVAPTQDDLLRALHDEHAAALWRYVVWICGDRQLAEDIVQETLLRAWRRPKVLDQSENSARAWLFTVARNLVTDHHRSARSRYEVASDSPPERLIGDGIDELLDRWLVADALAALSPEHRAVVVHAYYLGESVAAIAVQLEVPEGTVKSRLHYGLRALKLGAAGAGGDRMIDTYRDWDAAYLLGSLASAERREFEDHLSGCAECSASVAELAALPGLLARVPASEVESPAELPQDLLPRLVAAARRHRRRARGLTAGLVVASAAAAVAIALVLPGLLPGQPGERVAELTLSQVVPSTLSADVRLVAHDWGTSVEMNCTYDGGYGGPDVADTTYGLYLTDVAGHTTQLATWTARPGRTVEPSGTTSLALDEIRSVDVRALGSGTVLLEGSP